MTATESPGHLDGVVRTEVIRPPSARDEAAALIRASFHVVFCAALVIGAHRAASRRDIARQEPLGASAVDGPGAAFEVRSSSLSPDEQRIHRGLLEGLLEAEAYRADRGSWPDVSVLAQRGIPPFAPDPLDRAGYRWELRQGRGVVDYVGIPREDSGRKSFLVVIAEPAPGAPNDPLAKADEVHHRLPDGTMVHVTTWIGPAAKGRDVVTSVDPLAGYRHVRSDRPSSR